MNRLILIFIFSFLGLNLYSQEEIKGVVYDIGTRQTISDVSVQASNTRIHSKTDFSGYFSLQLHPLLTRPESLLNTYGLIGNTLHWEFQYEVLIKIYSLDGKNTFSLSSSRIGSIQIPIPDAGYYILTIYSGTVKVDFLIYSDGTVLQQAQKTNTTPTTPLYDSSLIFSMDGYYSREIPLHTENSEVNVNLLKTSYDDLHYFNELIRHEAFYMLHSSPPTSNYGEVQSIKALYAFKEDKIYYSNVNKYPSHYSFAKKFLDYGGSQGAFFWSQYNNHPNRYLHCITINYHMNIDKYVFQFISYDMVDCEGIRDAYLKLLETSFFDDKLYFYPNNLKWEDCPDIPKITAEEMYAGQNYQALNLEENYGYLKKVDLEDLPTTYPGRHDIVLLNGIPNDLSVVAGIITTEFQTALSHINILSHSRQTPNMALKDGWTNPKLDSLVGELVYLKVESDNFTIRSASFEDATLFWDQKEPQIPVTLIKDTETSGIIELGNEDISSVSKIGGKAANFAELVNLENIPTPENSFAIPFYYYQQHIENSGIDTLINNMLEDEDFHSNLEIREQKLEQVKALIIEAVIDPELLELVWDKIDHFDIFPAFRFRSSSNAEDLEYFSGAGLYNSYSAKKGHATKTVENAIKKVWASLWNIRAFDEREYFKIDQNSVAMAVLAHRSFPDEDANGVVITKNLYNVNHGYTINAQYKDYSIVYPEPGILHDQVITYTVNLGGNDYTIEYLSRSNIPELEGEAVLTDDELYELADYCTIIKQHYFNNIINCTTCEYATFAVDIEFKVDSQVGERKIYIKQTRIYSLE